MLQLPVKTIPGFGVQIGNVEIVRCNQLCVDVTIQLSDISITQDYYSFSMGGADLVLRIQWLASLQNNTGKLGGIFSSI